MGEDRDDDLSAVLTARASLVTRLLGPAWVEVEPGIFVRRDDERVVRSLHGEYDDAHGPRFEPNS